MSNLINTDVFETQVISFLVCDKCVADRTFLLKEILSWSGKKVSWDKYERIKRDKRAYIVFYLFSDMKTPAIGFFPPGLREQ